MNFYLCYLAFCYKYGIIIILWYDLVILQYLKLGKGDFLYYFVLSKENLYIHIYYNFHMLSFTISIFHNSFALS